MTTMVEHRAGAIRLLTCDVDGVLTDGRILVDDDGREFKAFSALDGVGLKMLMHTGITVAWITGSNAPAVLHRARALGVVGEQLWAAGTGPHWCSPPVKARSRCSDRCGCSASRTDVSPGRFGGPVR